jgi:hypothetical protein
MANSVLAHKDSAMIATQAQPAHDAPKVFDWADDLATEIVVDARTLSYGEARRLIAAHLRALRPDGALIAAQLCVQQQRK